MSLGLWIPGEWHPRSLEMRPQLNAPWKQPLGSLENLGTWRDGLGPGYWLPPLLSVLQVRFRPLRWLGWSHEVTVHGSGPTSLRTGFPGHQEVRAESGCTGSLARWRAWALLVRQLGCALRMLLGLADPVALSCVIWGKLHGLCELPCLPL